MEFYNENFRVVRILDEFTVVLNGGYDQGIKQGDLFQIFVPGETITDPEDPEKKLGTLDTIKATIVATQVSPSITICKNTEKPNISFPIGPEAQKMISFLSSAFSISERPMRVDPTQIQTASFSDEPIKIGDQVRKLPKEKN
ncbi:hypothetical protein [Hydrogenispora ethanolica]|jgi:hypothetical protein|uniref:hypothetical protein n=1 Tax=Hydrogenispora ethanolica TaxID=1082276 RepID=UPI00104A3171|nr:hypothetical protein [Hydrogenispora ethanolica]